MQVSTNVHTYIFVIRERFWRILEWSEAVFLGAISPLHKPHSSRERFNGVDTTTALDWNPEKENDYFNLACELHCFELTYTCTVQLSISI